MANLQDAFRGLENDRDEENAVNISGRLGIPINGRKEVEVPNRSGYVYVRLRGSTSELIQAFNDKVSPVYDLPVTLKWEGNRYVILSRDTQRYSTWGSYSSFLPRHGNQHSFDPDSGGGGDPVWVYPRQFMPFLVMPSGSYGGPNVVVSEYTYLNADGSWRSMGETGTFDLTPIYNPTGSSAVMMLIYNDTATGNPGFLVGSGSYFSEAITGTNQVVPYIPSLTVDGLIPLAAVRLVSGSSVIGWDNIYDVRQFSLMSDTPYNGVIAIQDEGIPVGTGTSFNFVGTNVDASVSAGVIRVFVTGSVGGIQGLEFQDEGAIAGTGDTLNVVGKNASITVSGTVARLYITGSYEKIPEGYGLQVGNNNAYPTSSFILFGDQPAIYEKYDDCIGIAYGANYTRSGDLIFAFSSARDIFVGGANSDYSDIIAMIGDIDAYTHGNYVRVDSTGTHTFSNAFLHDVKTGATQVAAGAAKDEVWATSGHATLPDNVLMIGV